MELDSSGRRKSGIELYTELRFLDSSAQRDLYFIRRERTWDIPALLEDLRYEHKRKIEEEKLAHRPSPFSGRSDYECALKQQLGSNRKRSQKHQDASSKLKPGSLVEVYWDGDERWYPAQVQDISKLQKTQQIAVQYPDGDRRHTILDLRYLDFPITSEFYLTYLPLAWRIPSKGMAAKLKKGMQKDASHSSGSKRPDSGILEEKVLNRRKRKRVNSQPPETEEERKNRLASEAKRAYMRKIVAELKGTLEKAGSGEKAIVRQIIGKEEATIKNDDVDLLPMKVKVLSRPHVTRNIRRMTFDGASQKQLLPYGCKLFAKALTVPRNFPMLQYLDLHNNAIEDEGLRDLAKALKHRIHLKTVILSQNRLRDPSGAYLAILIQTCPSLSVLDLNWNSLTARGAEEILHALEEKKDHQMSTITLTDNHVKRITIQQIQKLLRTPASPEQKASTSITRNHRGSGRAFRNRQRSIRNASTEEEADEEVARKIRTVIKHMREGTEEAAKQAGTLRIASHIRRNFEHIWTFVERSIEAGNILTVDEGVEILREQIERLLLTSTPDITTSPRTLCEIDLSYWLRSQFEKVVSNVLGFEVKDTPVLCPLMHIYVRGKSAGDSSRRARKSWRSWIPNPMMHSLARNPYRPLPVQKAGYLLLRRVEKADDMDWWKETEPEMAEMSEYLDSVPYPISSNDVRRRLQSSSYRDLDELVTDLRMVYENAAMWFGSPSVSQNEARFYLSAVKCLETLESSLGYIPYTIRPEAKPMPLELVMRLYHYVRRNRRMPPPRRSRGQLPDLVTLRKQRRRYSGSKISSSSSSSSKRRNGSSGGKGESNPSSRPPPVRYTEWRRVARKPTAKIWRLAKDRYTPYNGVAPLKQPSKEEAKKESSATTETEPGSGWTCVTCYAINRSGLTVCRHCWRRRWNQTKRRLPAASLHAAAQRILPPAPVPGSGSSVPLAKATGATAPKARPTTQSLSQRSAAKNGTATAISDAKRSASSASDRPTKASSTSKQETSSAQLEKRSSRPDLRLKAKARAAGSQGKRQRGVPRGSLQSVKPGALKNIINSQQRERTEKRRKWMHAENSDEVRG